MAKRNPPVRIDEPIDFDRLHDAYQQARWKWSGGMSPSIIENTFNGLRGECLKNNSRYCASGGLIVRGNEGEIVELHPKLAAFYLEEQKPIICQTWNEFEQEQHTSTNPIS